MSQFPPHPTDSNNSATTDVTPVVALKELVARLHREQNKIQDLLGSLGFALRSFHNLNQFLVFYFILSEKSFICSETCSYFFF